MHEPWNLLLWCLDFPVGKVIKSCMLLPIAGLLLTENLDVSPSKGHILRGRLFILMRCISKSPGQMPTTALDERR
jgi:hypothetical protein